MDWCSHLGSVWMRPSLEVDDTIGVTRARFCVFFHRPLLGHCRRLVGVLTQLHIRVLGGQAGREANVLPDQPPTAAPDKNRIVKLAVQWSSYLLHTCRSVFKLSSYKAFTCWSADHLKRGKWGTRDNCSLVQKKKRGGAQFLNATILCLDVTILVLLHIESKEVNTFHLFIQLNIYSTYPRESCIYAVLASFKTALESRPAN